MDLTTSGAPTAEEMAAGLAGLASPLPPPAEPATAVVRWLGDRKRVESYELLYPFEIDGVEHRTITIKRLTAGAVAAFIDRMSQAGRMPGRFPMYFHGDAEISDAAWDALDDDDRLALTEIGADFLPARFRPRTESDAS